MLSKQVRKKEQANEESNNHVLISKQIANQVNK